MTDATRLPIHYLSNKKTTTVDNASKPIIPESHEQDTGLHHSILLIARLHCKMIWPQSLKKKKEEEEEEKHIDPADQDTLVFNSEESDEEPFNTTVDTTSDDSAITMGKPVTTAFISNLVQVPTEQVGCLQVTNQLQELLDQYQPKLTEKAFEHIYQILQVLDKYLVNNPKQHQHCMSPDSEYITLIVYATKLEIDLCNFPAIWAVLMSSDLQYVQCLQQVFNDYYDTHTQDAMTELEQQAIKIQDIMYDSMTKYTFDRVPGAVDRVSGAIDNDLDKVDTNRIKPTYDNDSNTNTGSTKHDQNTKGAPKDTDTQDNVQNDRHDNKVTQVKWSTETNEIDNQYLRNYGYMCRQIEDKQNEEYYKAQRQIHSAIMGDTPVKTVQNRQYIDNISPYDSELQRISKLVHHKLDLGQNSLLGAQQYTTIKAAAAIKAQDKVMKVPDKEHALKVCMSNDNGQYKREIYRRAEYIIPQLDGTFNASDSSDVDSHDYFNLANIDTMQRNSRGQKKRQKAAEAKIANMHLANRNYKAQY